MNLLTEFVAFLAMVFQANTVATQKRQFPKPRLAQVVIDGPGMIRVIDFDTRQVLGYRQTPSEARTLALQLERGELSA